MVHVFTWLHVSASTWSCRERWKGIHQSFIQICQMCSFPCSHMSVAGIFSNVNLHNMFASGTHMYKWGLFMGFLQMFQCVLHLMSARFSKSCYACFWNTNVNISFTCFCLHLVWGIIHEWLDNWFMKNFLCVIDLSCVVCIVFTCIWTNVYMQRHTMFHVFYADSNATR